MGLPFAAPSAPGSPHQPAQSVTVQGKHLHFVLSLHTSQGAPGHDTGGHVPPQLSGPPHAPSQSGIHLHSLFTHCFGAVHVWVGHVFEDGAEGVHAPPLPCCFVLIFQYNLSPLLQDGVGYASLHADAKSTCALGDSP